MKHICIIRCIAVDPSIVNTCIHSESECKYDFEFIEQMVNSYLCIKEIMRMIMIEGNVFAIPRAVRPDE